MPDNFNDQSDDPGQDGPFGFKLMPLLETITTGNGENYIDQALQVTAMTNARYTIRFA